MEIKLYFQISSEYIDQWGLRFEMYTRTLWLSKENMI